MKDQIKSLVSTPAGMFSLGTVAGLVVGAGATYIWNRRQTSCLIDEIEELSDANGEIYEELCLRNNENLEMNAAFQELKTVVRELREMGIDMLHDLKGDDEEPVSLPRHNEVIAIPVEIEATNDTLLINDTLVNHNIFDAANDGWDYEFERSTRTKEVPYIIHADEFSGDEMGYESQTTLTWYEGDHILTDSNDVPIYNPHTVVGELRFGHGSGDPSVVYIRNERLEAEYEVLLDPGSYEVIVLGGASDIEAEYEGSDLRHSRGPRKFRED